MISYLSSEDRDISATFVRSCDQNVPEKMGEVGRPVATGYIRG